MYLKCLRSEFEQTFYRKTNSSILRVVSGRKFHLVLSSGRRRKLKVNILNLLPIYKYLKSSCFKGNIGLCR